MLHYNGHRISAIRPKKESKRRYLNLKSNENLSSGFEDFERIRPDVLDHGDVFRYPVYDDAYAALRAHLGVPNVLFTAGCHDAIRVLASSLARAGNRILVTMPNYDGYRHYLQVHGIEVVLRHRGPDRRHDLSALVAQAVSEHCNAIILTNPDPFVGDCFERQEIVDLLDECAGHGVTLILDEVYAGFGRDSDVTLVAGRDNLVVLNSLSKSYGLPGVRVGWIAGPEQAIERFGCEFPESGISGFSLAMAEKVLAEPTWVAEFRASVVRNREALAALLAGLDGVALYPKSNANFLLFCASETPGSERLWSHLLDQGVYVADLEHIPGFRHHYRVTACPQGGRQLLFDGLSGFACQTEAVRRETA